MEAVLPSPDYPTLYDFETQLAEPVRTLIAARVAPNTPRESAPVYTRINGAKLNKEKANVQIRFQLGATTRHKKVFDQANDVWRYDAWEGQYALQVVTPTNAQNIHGLWVATCRDVMGNLRYLMTAELFPYHCLNDVFDIGSTPTIKNADGYEATTLLYGVHFNIRTNQWPANP